MPDCRYYQVGGLTIQVESYLPITDTTFHARFEPFEVDGPGEDNLLIRHHFTPFDFQNHDLGRRVYRQTPWSIYRKGDRWIYLSVSPTMDDTQAGDVGVLSVDHTQAEMYHAREDTFRRGDLHSLSMFTTDQIILSHVFADRQAVIIHSGAVIMNGQGLLFAGHSEAGKSTTMTLLKDAGTGAEILCDDRNIVRKWDNVQDLPGFGNLTSLHGWRVHGTWSHGDIPDVSPASAPLRAALFLEQAPHNRIIPLTDRKEIWKRLLATLIRPLMTAEWWHKQLDVLETIVQEVPCYLMQFDKTGAIVPLLDRLTQDQKTER